MRKRIKRLLIGMLATAMVASSTGCMAAALLLDDETTTAEQTEKEAANDPTKEAASDSGEAEKGTDSEETDSVDIVTDFSENLRRYNFTKTADAKTATVLVYMNGSNLESDDGEATTDLSEMVAATKSSNVNILVQTMGTKKWNSQYGISAKKTQRYQVTESGLKLVDNSLSQLDCTAPSTLKDFVNWGVANYPADRYILVFWDHGGGPVYGFGYDEWNSDSNAALTIDEIRLALTETGIKFDFIGMDCCIMASLETCVAFYPVCDYTILSEEFETGLGWSYTGWLSALAKNPSISTPDLAKIVIDDMVSANESDKQDGGASTLACIDESMIKVLMTTWIQFAYANESTLLNKDYSRHVKAHGRTLNRSGDSVSLSEYYVNDIMMIAEAIDSTESKALQSAVNNAMVYYRETSDEITLTGLSITLPYGDSTFYSQLKTIFSQSGIDSEYITWLEKFVSAEGTNDFYDFDGTEDSWSGWDDYEDDYDWYDWEEEYDQEEYDGYWDEDSWCLSDDEIEEYYGKDWDDEYWDEEYDPNYWEQDDDCEDGDYDDYDDNYEDGDDDYYDDYEDGDYDDYYEDGDYDDYYEDGDYDDYYEDGDYDDYEDGYYDDYDDYYDDGSYDDY